MRLPLKPAGAGLLLAVGFPVASAATLGVAAGTLGAGRGVPGACLSAATTVVQNVPKANVESVDVTGVDPGCGGGTAKVTVDNGRDAAVQGTVTVPAGGGRVTVTLAQAVELLEAVFVAVSVQGP